MNITKIKFDISKKEMAVNETVIKLGLRYSESPTELTLTLKWFSFFVLLGLQRKETPDGFVSLKKIQENISWGATDFKNIGKSISRFLGGYIHDIRMADLIRVISLVYGPYQLKIKPENLDIDIASAKEFLKAQKNLIITSPTIIIPSANNTDELFTELQDWQTLANSGIYHPSFLSLTNRYLAQRKFPDDLLQIKAWLILSTITKHQGNFRVSLPLVRKAIKIAQKIKHPTILIDLLMVLGGNYHVAHDFQKALAVYQQAEELIKNKTLPKKIKKSLLADVTRDLGSTYFGVRNDEAKKKAEKITQQSMELAKEADNLFAYTLAEQQLGKFLINTNWDKAGELLHQAEKDLTPDQRVAETMLYNFLAEFYLKKDKHSKEGWGYLNKAWKNVKTFGLINEKRTVERLERRYKI